MKFTEAQLESAIIELLGVEGYRHVLGEAIERQPQELEIVGHEKRIPDGILTNLRALLLPNLISGEFTVPAA